MLEGRGLKEHMVRKAGKPGVKIIFDEQTPISSSKDDFLRHDDNKQRLIDMLAQQLRRAEYDVLNAQDDADYLLATTAIETATSMPTVLVGDDTDLLCLLIHHGAERHLHQLTLKTSVKEKADDEPRVWNVQKLIERMGEDMAKRILFLHAFSGCDTTSRIFIKDKYPVLKLHDDKRFQQVADIFMDPASSKENVVAAGETGMILLYDGRQTKNTSLTQVRKEKFCDRTALSKMYVSTSAMPPTVSAAKQHSLRVHLQIMAWLGLSLDPKKWGWELKGSKYYPKYTENQPAPDNLLKVVRCGCKGDCSSLRCSCKRNGLDCSSACKECKGISCRNVSLVEDDDLDDTEQSMDIDVELSLLQ